MKKDGMFLRIVFLAEHNFRTAYYIVLAFVDDLQVWQFILAGLFGIPCGQKVFRADLSYSVE